MLQVSGKHGTVAAIKLAKRLIQLGPKSLNKAFFSTGGSESNEFALKLARQFTKKPDVAYLENGYHGLSLGSLEVTASEKYRDSAGKPLGTDNYAIPTAYCYLPLQVGPGRDVQGRVPRWPRRAVSTRARRPPRSSPRSCRPSVASPRRRSGRDRLDRSRKARGILLIADEVQTGLGRTGKMFAVEHYGLEPRDHDGRQGACRAASARSR